jgi:hypothetical protein
MNYIKQLLLFLQTKLIKSQAKLIKFWNRSNGFCYYPTAIDIGKDFMCRLDSTFSKEFYDKYLSDIYFYKAKNPIIFDFKNVKYISPSFIYNTFYFIKDSLTSLEKFNKYFKFINIDLFDKAIIELEIIKIIRFKNNF